LARQVAHQRAHVLAGLDAGLPPAETSGHQAHQLIEMAADGPDLYHGSGSRPRFFLRHNSKIIGRLSCVTNRPLPAQITISDCRTSTRSISQRRRTEGYRLLRALANCLNSSRVMTICGPLG